METIEKLKKVLEETTGTKPEKFDIEGNIRTQLNLDSMQFVQLFSALEEEFATELPLSIMNVNTLKEFIEIIEESAPLNMEIQS